MPQSSVMIVEDEGLIAEGIATQLRASGYDVFSMVASGEDALASLGESRPDLVLMDIRLSGPLDGIDTAVRMRSEFNLPVIFLTSHADAETLSRAKQAEPFGYLVKPVRKLNLCSTIEMAMHKSRSDRALQEREAWLSAVLQSIADPTIVANAEGEIQFLNTSAEALLGCELKNVKGSKWTDAVVLVQEDLETKALPALQGTTMKMPPGLVIAVGSGGAMHQIPVEIVFAPTATLGDDVGGSIITIRDISMRVMEEAMAREKMLVLGEVAVQNIAKRLQSQEDLVKTLADLQGSNDELKQYAYIAFHDLQEPLRSVTSYTQLLAKRYTGRLDARAEEFIAHAVEGCSRMQSIIQDLLSHARAGETGNPPGKASGEEQFDYALEILRTAIEQSEAMVTRDTLPEVAIDGTQLCEVFLNLVGNAIKFRGAEAPRIHVSAARGDGAEWIFSVRDNGLGIKPQYFERIFFLFQRLHGRDELQGTGTGLAICKKVVERRGGRIWVESEPGKGSTFYFTLPETESKQAIRRT